ncbi:unnamed protein product [Heterobilharzia americana]|nr:unnamed protein product [Heterobilharzia americana]
MFRKYLFNKYEKPEKYIENAQCYLNKLGYNYTGMQFFPINRNAPIVRSNYIIHSLSSLIYDYADAYHRHQHKLPYILEKIHWKGIVIPFKRGFYKSEINTLLDHYSRFLRGSTDILTKKNLHSILPNISSDSCTITKGKQPIPYNKAIRLSSVSDKTGQMTSSSVDSNKWICVTNLPVNNSLSEKSQMITNSYQIRI